MEFISNITTEECVGWFTAKVHTEKIKTTHFHFQKNTSSQRSAGRMFCCKSLRTYKYLTSHIWKKFNKRTSNVTQIFRQSNFTATRDARHFTLQTSHFTSHHTVEQWSTANSKAAIGPFRYMERLLFLWDALMMFWLLTVSSNQLAASAAYKLFIVLSLRPSRHRFSQHWRSDMRNTRLW